MIIAAIPIPMVDMYWDTIKAYFEKLGESRKVNIPIKDLQSKVLRGMTIPVIIKEDNHICTVCMLEFKPNSIYICYMYGNRMAEWIDDAISKVKAIAKENKLESVKINIEEQETRKGWVRALKKYGFEINGNELECLI